MERDCDVREERHYVCLVGCPIGRFDVKKGVSVDFYDIRECGTTDVHTESTRDTVLMNNSRCFV